jgi:hypothetical protein
MHSYMYMYIDELASEEESGLALFKPYMNDIYISKLPHIQPLRNRGLFTENHKKNEDTLIRIFIFSDYQ